MFLAHGRFWDSGVYRRFHSYVNKRAQQLWPMCVKIVKHSYRRLFIEGKWASRQDDSHAALGLLPVSPHYGLADWRTSTFTPGDYATAGGSICLHLGKRARKDESPLSLLVILHFFWWNLSDLHKNRPSSITHPPVSPSFCSSDYQFRVKHASSVSPLTGCPPESYHFICKYFSMWS